MTKRIYKIEKFIPRTGNPVFQINEELNIDGKVIQLDPRNPTAQELTDADDVFAIAQQSRITELEAIKATLETEKATAITERDAARTEKDSLATQVASLTSELAATNSDLSTAISERDEWESSYNTALSVGTKTVETLNAEKDSLTSQVASLTSEKASLAETIAIQAELRQKLDAKIAYLMTEVNFKTRVISSDAFFDRLTGKELFALGQSKDAMTMQIAAIFSEYQFNKWRVEFDSTDYTNPIGYLISQGVLTEERAKEISRDATRAEAYKAPE